MPADRRRRRAALRDRRRPTFTWSLPPLPEWSWAVAGAVIAIAALLYSVRGAPLGLPVGDDFAPLARVSSGAPLDPLDSMGASSSWRPLSRQLYFSAVGRWLVPLLSSPVPVAGAPAVVLGNLILLLAIYAVIFAAARRPLGAPAAAAMAAFPLLAEPTRVLLAHPGGAAQLLVTLLVAIGLWAAIAGRRVAAALAALAAILAHEAGALALPLLPAIAWLRTRDRRATLVWGALGIGVALAWGVGWLLAGRHGVAWPEVAAPSWSAVPSVLAGGFIAQLNLEDLGPLGRALLGFAYAVLGALLLLAVASHAGRARLRGWSAVIPVGLIAFAAGMLLEAWTPPWNAWRTTLPALGLGVALTGALGVLHPGLAIGLAVLRLVGLALAPAAPPLVSAEPPRARSEISFTRLARHQLLVEETRFALLDRYPTLPPGAEIRYLGLPGADEIAFGGGDGPRTWYGDSTLAFRTLGGPAGLRARSDAVIQFSLGHRQVAVVIETEALALWRKGRLAFQSGKGAAADELFTQIFTAQPRLAPQFFAQIARSQARVAYNLGDRARADSLNQLDLKWGGPGPYHAALAARLAFDRGDLSGARRWLQECLSADPDNREGRALLAEMDLRPPTRP